MSSKPRKFSRPSVRRSFKIERLQQRMVFAKGADIVADHSDSPPVEYVSILGTLAACPSSRFWRGDRADDFVFFPAR